MATERKMIGHFEAEGLVSVSRASQWLAAVTRPFRGRTETDPSWVIFCSRVVVWELPLVLRGHDPEFFLMPALEAGDDNFSVVVIGAGLSGQNLLGFLPDRVGLKSENGSIWIFPGFKVIRLSLCKYMCSLPNTRHLNTHTHTHIHIHIHSCSAYPFAKYFLNQKLHFLIL